MSNSEMSAMQPKAITQDQAEDTIVDMQEADSNQHLEMITPIEPALTRGNNENANEDQQMEI